MSSYCMKCGAELKSDEIAIYKKMVNRGATEYLCCLCLGKKFNISQELIAEKIQHFKDMGCTLFGK
ncbi:MAG: hypothetical protein E7388_05320 [Ruminococcaceae bacterium]|nr:hypothetical protein [Oscillospiraceae bacterium]